MRILLVLAIVTALVSGARAQDCIPLSNTQEIDQTTPAGQFYVDNDLCQPAEHGACIVSFWVYQESNGISEMQRRDIFKDNTCGGLIPADTILFGIYGRRPA